MALLAGGCVRDALLNRPFQDVDIVTDAGLDQLKTWFPQAILVGANFGVLKVPFGSQVFDLAQLRKESDYQNGRHPQLVSPGTLLEDAQRRDFTINALFYDPISEELHDYVNGLFDLKARVIRAVGDPDIRFSEDYLRILRALRFQSQLGFEIESELTRAMLDKAPLLVKLSYERRLIEMVKIRQGHYFKNVQVNKKLLTEIVSYATETAIPQGYEISEWPLFEMAWPSQVIGQMLLEMGVSLSQLTALETWPWSRKERQIFRPWLDGLRAVKEGHQSSVLNLLISCTNPDFFSGIQSGLRWWPDRSHSSDWQKLLSIVHQWEAAGIVPVPLIKFQDLKALIPESCTINPEQVRLWQQKIYQFQLEHQITEASQMIKIALQLLNDSPLNKN